ncbi:MAG: ABC transporter permease [Candidatus Heimdallarchaeota archaeon]|nr:ABC transporter permease [Candidatus Heimdallarchaeota archaeon]
MATSPGKTKTLDESLTDGLDTDLQARVAQQSTNQWVLVGQRIKKNRIATLAFYYVLLNILIAILFPVVIAYAPNSRQPGLDRRFGGGSSNFPNLKYPGGTDVLGLDTFSRGLAGAQTSMLVGVLSTTISLLIGVTVGLYAGYYQGKVEEIAMRITDLFLAVPFLIIALILLSMINRGQAGALNGLDHVQIITILIGIFGWAGLARLVTANVKQVSSFEYIDAVRIMGASDKRIMFIHILPNTLAPVIVIGAIFIAGGILSEAGLAFLGFGDPVNTISWGIQVNLSRTELQSHKEQALIPGFAIFFLVLGVNLFGDAIRDALDPKLKE